MYIASYAQAMLILIATKTVASGIQNPARHQPINLQPHIMQASLLSSRNGGACAHPLRRVHQPSPCFKPQVFCRVSQDQATDTATVADASSSKQHEYKLTLRKPVGLVFAQKPEGGPVYVEEVTQGGHADKTGQVQVGDVLSKCSAVVLKTGMEGRYENEGYGETPYTNFERIVFDCEGQSFKDVMSALKSNNARWGIMDVTMWFSRPASN